MTSGADQEAAGDRGSGQETGPPAAPESPSDDAQFDLIPELAQARAVAEQAARTTRHRDRGASSTAAASHLPVARVVVDVPLAHLDRDFDYLVPASLADEVVPGARVQVMFAGRSVGAFVLERVADAEHPGRLAPIRRAVSREPVLSREIATLVEQVAHRYAGTRADVLRLAVPPRHARVEREPVGEVAPPPAEAVVSEASEWWQRYPGGAGLVGDWASGAVRRNVWTALPGEDWATGLACAAAATAAGGLGAVLCVPDRRDLTRLDRALGEVLGPGRHVVLHADAGPSERYRSFLAVSRGQVRVVAGTRAAAFAPVHRLGLVAIWDDGDDLYAEPRAPYPHAREVLLLRAHRAKASALLGATGRSVEAAALVQRGWAQEVLAERTAVRARAPRVDVAGATEEDVRRDPWSRQARLPPSTQAAVRAALAQGPVLVQTPRTGYAEALACDGCRGPVRCGHCAGGLHQPHRDGDLSCRWCGRSAPEWTCDRCGHSGARAVVVGERRTAEELGRAFPGIPVLRSSGGQVRTEVAERPALVVATPGAEPQAEHGYAAVVLLDTWLTLARTDLRTEEEAARRWFNAATAARPSSQDGRVLVVGEASQPAIQALVRWDPAGFAERELDQRTEARLPPAARLAVIEGQESDVESTLADLELPEPSEVLGPVPATTVGSAADPTAGAGASVRVVVRVPHARGRELSASLRRVQSLRSARKQPPVRVQVDPHALG